MSLAYLNGKKLFNDMGIQPILTYIAIGWWREEKSLWILHRAILSNTFFMRSKISNKYDLAYILSSDDLEWKEGTRNTLHSGGGIPPGRDSSSMTVQVCREHVINCFTFKQCMQWATVAYCILLSLTIYWPLSFHAILHSPDGYLPTPCTKLTPRIACASPSSTNAACYSSLRLGGS